jgi:hypothetical protein
MTYKWTKNKIPDSILDKFKKIHLSPCGCGGLAQFILASNDSLQNAVRCTSCNARTAGNNTPVSSAKQWNLCVNNRNLANHRPGVKMKVPVPLEMMGLGRKLKIKKCACGSEADVIFYDHKLPYSTICCKSCKFETELQETPLLAQDAWNII